MKEILVRVPAAVKMTGLPRSTLYRFIAEGTIPSIVLDGRRMFHVPTLEKWAQDLAKESEATRMTPVTSTLVDSATAKAAA